MLPNDEWLLSSVIKVRKPKLSVRFHLGSLYWENRPDTWFTQVSNTNHETSESFGLLYYFGVLRSALSILQNTPAKWWLVCVFSLSLAFFPDILLHCRFEACSFSDLPEDVSETHSQALWRKWLSNIWPTLWSLWRSFRQGGTKQWQVLQKLHLGKNSVNWKSLLNLPSAVYTVCDRAYLTLCIQCI